MMIFILVLVSWWCKNLDHWNGFVSTKAVLVLVDLVPAKNCKTTRTDILNISYLDILDILKSMDAVEC